MPVKEEIFTIGANGSFIGNTLALPVPFPYYHILILVVDYFFAIAFVDMNSTLVTAFLVLMLGSRARSALWILGDDEQDFPINAYITKLRASIAPLVIDTPWSPVQRSSQLRASNKWHSSRTREAPGHAALRQGYRVSMKCPEQAERVSMEMAAEA